MDAIICHFAALVHVVRDKLARPTDLDQPGCWGRSEGVGPEPWDKSPLSSRSLTVKKTANTALACGQGWTILESLDASSNGSGPLWTSADGELAVFKTAGFVRRSPFRFILVR